MIGASVQHYWKTATTYPTAANILSASTLRMHDSLELLEIKNTGRSSGASLKMIQKVQIFNLYIGHAIFYSFVQYARTRDNDSNC